MSQSVQFAPFTHDYNYDNSTADNYIIYAPDTTQPNTFHGSAVQQSVSGLADIPANAFNGSGGEFAVFGELFR